MGNADLRTPSLLRARTPWSPDRSQLSFEFEKADRGIFAVAAPPGKEGFDRQFPKRNLDRRTENRDRPSCVRKRSAIYHRRSVARKPVLRLFVRLCPRSKRRVLFLVDFSGFHKPDAVRHREWNQPVRLRLCFLRAMS